MIISKLLLIILLSFKGISSRENLFIYTDIKSKDQDVSRRSKSVSELYRDFKYRFLNKERLWIFWHYNIIVKDYDLDYQELKYAPIKRFPAIKFNKNGEYQYFPEGSFSASGSFTRTLYKILVWDYFKVSREKWCLEHTQGYGLGRCFPLEELKDMIGEDEKYAEYVKSWKESEERRLLSEGAPPYPKVKQVKLERE